MSASSRAAAPSSHAVTGLLNVDKPPGWTSFDVVAFVRKQTGVRRVGHAGTLDPAATGVLPVCLGQATRVVEYLVDATKTYVATVRLGRVTDTYDADGAVQSEADASGVSREAVEAALDRFRGLIEQRPPPFSALKRDGVPLYKLARAGQAAEAAPRRVTIYRLDITKYEPPLLSLEIECGKGTYVRSLAHDLGASLGVGGSLASLVRTRVGPFALADAIDIEALRPRPRRRQMARAPLRRGRSAARPPRRHTRRCRRSAPAARQRRPPRGASRPPGGRRRALPRLRPRRRLPRRPPLRRRRDLATREGLRCAACGAGRLTSRAPAAVLSRRAACYTELRIDPQVEHPCH